MLRSPKWPLSYRFSDLNFVHIFPVLTRYHALLILLDLITVRRFDGNTNCGAPPALVSILLSLGSEYSPQHFVFQYLSVLFSLD